MYVFINIFMTCARVCMHLYSLPTWRLSKEQIGLVGEARIPLTQLLSRGGLCHRTVGKSVAAHFLVLVPLFACLVVCLSVCLSVCLCGGGCLCVCSLVCL